MVLPQPPPPAYIAPSAPTANPPQYSASNSTDGLPNYNDPSHNFNPSPPRPSTIKVAPPEATATGSDLEANTICVYPNALDTTHCGKFHRRMKEALFWLCAALGMFVLFLPLLVTDVVLPLHEE
ncbi:hypothetical protein DOTSEDRAFT_54376 [Dothistroma septosporum NZE10]|uniref:Uncharacterized protein n=1 Tax=Dothistroma septosporum (strain NZE10 / CBS 128990) TaxID=675120 RepID=M2Y5T3_DOTSN|nr:hypothetical protein DOTSEDRAFT_54376 [Dothistroma septosporum NZE10]